MAVTVEAVQVLGDGYVKEYPWSAYAGHGVTQIYEGTNEIQRLVIAVR